MSETLAAGPMTGNKMKLLYSTSFASGATFTEIAAVGDVSLETFEREMVEFASRGSAYKKKIAGMMEAPVITAKLIHNLDPTLESALQTAMINATPLNLKILNGPAATSGVTGLQIPVLVSKMPWSQNLSEVSGRDIQFELTYAVDSSTVVEPTVVSVT